MKEMTELVNDSWKPLVKKPQIPEFWHGGNKGTSLCLQLIQKMRTWAQCHKNLFPPPNHDKTILFQLNKSSPQSTPALPGNPSSTKSFCQLHHWLFPQGSGNLELQTELQEAVLLSDKKHLLVPHCREGEFLQHWNIEIQTFTLPQTFILPLQKGWFWLLWHYINFCHVHKWWCVWPYDYPV